MAQKSAHPVRLRASLPARVSAAQILGSGRESPVGQGAEGQQRDRGAHAAKSVFRCGAGDHCPWTRLPFTSSPNLCGCSLIMHVFGHGLQVILAVN